MSIDTVKKKIAISTDFLSRAIKGLRIKMGLSQEAMAQAVGCTFAAYRQWESGRRIPSGDWLIKIMTLCPDRESLESFGVRIPHVTSASLKSHSQEAEVKREQEMTTTEKAREVRRLLRELRSQAQSGDRYAKEGVEAVEEELIRAAGIVTHPGLSKGRRQEQLRAGIKRLAGDKNKLSVGT